MDGKTICFVPTSNTFNIALMSSFCSTVFWFQLFRSIEVKHVKMLEEGEQVSFKTTFRNEEL